MCGLYLMTALSFSGFRYVRGRKRLGGYKLLHSLENTANLDFRVGLQVCTWSEQ